MLIYFILILSVITCEAVEMQNWRQVLCGDTAVKQMAQYLTRSSRTPSLLSCVMKCAIDKRCDSIVFEMHTPEHQCYLFQTELNSLIKSLANCVPATRSRVYTVYGSLENIKAAEVRIATHQYPLPETTSSLTQRSDFKVQFTTIQDSSQSTRRSSETLSSTSSQIERTTARSGNYDISKESFQSTAQAHKSETTNIITKTGKPLYSSMPIVTETIRPGNGGTSHEEFHHPTDVSKTETTAMIEKKSPTLSKTTLQFETATSISENLGASRKSFRPLTDKKRIQAKEFQGSGQSANLLTKMSTDCKCFFPVCPEAKSKEVSVNIVATAVTEEVNGTSFLILCVYHHYKRQFIDQETKAKFTGYDYIQDIIIDSLNNKVYLLIEGLGKHSIVSMCSDGSNMATITRGRLWRRMHMDRQRNILFYMKYFDNNKKGVLIVQHKLQTKTSELLKKLLKGCFVIGIDELNGILFWKDGKKRLIRSISYLNRNDSRKVTHKVYHKSSFLEIAVVEQLSSIVWCNNEGSIHSKPYKTPSNDQKHVGRCPGGYKCEGIDVCGSMSYYIRCKSSSGDRNYVSIWTKEGKMKGIQITEDMVWIG